MTLNAVGDYSLGILAGGQGQRWGGRDKGLIAFNGRPLLANVCQPRPVRVREILICCRDNAHFYRHYGDRVLCDSLPNRGPCAGISALLSATETQTVMILPADLLSTSTPLIDAMEATWTEEDQAIVLTDPLGHHSPCLRLAKAALMPCCAFIEGGGTKLSDLLELLNARRVPVEGAWLRDADSPAAMAAYAEP